MTNFLTKKREVTCEWHYNQAKELSNYANRNKMTSPLIYAAFEARNAIERYFFDLSIAATGGSLSDLQLENASKKSGMFNLLKEITKDARKYCEFCIIISHVDQMPFKMNVPNFKTLMKFNSQLSKYCHPQIDPKMTIDDVSEKWFTECSGLIVDTVNELDRLHYPVSGLMNRNSIIHNEVAETLDLFMSNNIDKFQLKRRLEIMSPILEQRNWYKNL